MRMRWVSSLRLRVRTLFKKSSVEAELRAEMEFHLEQRVEELVACGMGVGEALRAAQREMRAEREMEKCRDERAWQWWERLRADVVFGWRQLRKRKVTTAAAVLSLGLAIGSCMAAFRLVDALFLRPLPIAHPERLYAVERQGSSFRDGKPANAEASFEYPLFQQMQDAVKDQATVIGVSPRRPTDVTFGGVEELEKTQIAYVSGSMFGVFGMRAAAGRLLTESDDAAPGAGPYAVISYDYWTRKFGRDPKVVGRVMHMGDSANEIGENSYQVVGVAPKGFTGTQPGTVTEIFLPLTMDVGVKNPTWSWVEAFVVLRRGVAAGPVGEKIEAVFQQQQHEVAKGFSGRGKEFLERYFSWHTRLALVKAGISDMQRNYRLPLMVLCVVVGMVLLIACVNVANLMSAQSAARAREMAVRTAMGAGKARLVRLVMVESAMLGMMAAVLGVVFAWWAAPYVVSKMSTEQWPVRLELQPDWTVAGFGFALAMVVTVVFGMMPALRASRVRPATALKGNEDAAAKGRGMYALMAAQVAFCMVVLFGSGLFGATFTKLMQRPLGFAAQGVVVIDTTATRSMPATVWEQTAALLRSAPGVEQVGLSISPLLSGDAFGSFIRVNGVANPKLAMTLAVSPGWVEAMHVSLLDGRDLSAQDSEPNAPAVALVSRSFAREYFGTTNAVGRRFVAVGSDEPVRVVGVTGDVLYQNVREENAPMFYGPYRRSDEKGSPGANAQWGVQCAGERRRMRRRWRTRCGGWWWRRSRSSAYRA